jgi:hypothetical protein
MSDDAEGQPSMIHYFVDEAGDPNLFDGKGRDIIGTPGCSNYFIMGKLDIGDPGELADDLQDLRTELLADPYFKDVPSMQPQNKKTALAFHAKDDLPEVRREVYRLLLMRDVRFYAVIRDKRALISQVRAENKRTAGYRYSPNDLYDELVKHLFSYRWFTADHFNICFATRGNSRRTDSLRAALEGGGKEFERGFGFASKAQYQIDATVPKRSAGLQAVDYFLWALQRFCERGESRYVEMIWPKTVEVIHLDLLQAGQRGIHFNRERPIWLEGQK